MLCCLVELLSTLTAGNDLDRVSARALNFCLLLLHHCLCQFSTVLIDLRFEIHLLLCLSLAFFELNGTCIRLYIFLVSLLQSQHGLLFLVLQSHPVLVRQLSGRCCAVVSGRPMRFHLKGLLVKVVIHSAAPEKKGLSIVLRLLELQVVMMQLFGILS